MTSLLLTAGTIAKGATLGQMLTLAGGAVSAAGSISKGNATKATSEFTAKQMDQQAAAERAAGSLAAEDQARQKELVLSRARAVGAASGGGQDFNLLGQIEEEGTYRTLVANWQGEEAAKGRSLQADALRAEGDMASSAGWMGAGQTILSTGATVMSSAQETLLEKYG